MIEIVTMGTGSAIPNILRNHSSTAIVRDGDIYLFDCGEATQHQIQKVGLRHSKIQAIFISHLHGDHVFGLPGLLTTLGLNGRDIPLSVYGPPGIKEYVSEMLRLVSAVVEYSLQVVEMQTGIEYDLGEVHVTALPLKHGVLTYGFRIREDDKPGKFDLEHAVSLGIPAGPLFGQLQKGNSIEWNGKTIHPADVLGEARRGCVLAYILDTEPCENAKELAHNADAALFDGTYTDEDVDYARRGQHSTHAEAYSMAQEAGVKMLILTHFSQRYVAPFKNFTRDGMKVVFAYDKMRIQVC